MFDESHRQDAFQNLMRQSWDKGIYGVYAIFHIIQGDHVEESLDALQFAADWFEHPHPHGRDHRGEADFTAIRMICALYEPQCYNRLTDPIRRSIRRFYQERDYSSIYGSENHALMFRTARYLAAQFYEKEFFANYGMTAEEIVERDRQYLHEFLNFRGRKGWGEFDSLNYADEILIILATLHKYTKDSELKQKCHMAMDIILLDMAADSLGELYAGAHGRSYPDSILSRETAPMVRLFRYYFGGRFYNGEEITNEVNLYLSDYIPSPIVYEIVNDKKLPYESRERKHLHCMSAWCDEIAWETLEKEKGSINKYTYVCEDYAIGAINRQEDYSEETSESDRSYAHHQQHEWELTLPGGSGHMLFTHHKAIPDYHKVNNRWTGDHLCCCGSYYANRNTAVIMYNIKNREKLPVINGYADLNVFRRSIVEEKYLFLEYGKLYLSLYFDNGFHFNHEDEFENRELLSEGWQNAVVCRVEYQEDYPSLEAFAEHIKSLPVIFDRRLKKVTFDGIEVRRDGNSENGVENSYPYAYTYDCPFMKSLWDSGIIEITHGDKKVIYDFIQNVIR